MHTVPVDIKQKCPAYGYFNRDVAGSRKVRNKANFLIRNTMTGLKKPEEKRTDNEKVALEEVFSGLDIANGLRKARGRRLFSYPTADQWMLSYGKLDAIMKYTNDEAYYSCTSQVNQQAIKKTVDSWNAYFKARKDYAKHPEKYSGKPHIPGYIRTEGTTAHYTNQVAEEVRKDGRLYLKLTNYGFLDIGPKSMLPGTLVKVEAKPRYGSIRLLLTYEDDFKAPKVPKQPTKIMGIDLGVTNLMTCVTNTGMSPFIIDGRQVKAINQWYNKRRAEICSAMELGGKEKAEAASLDALSRRRDDCLRDFFYKASHEVCRRASAEGIEVIVIGHTDGQKQKICIGDANDQNFVQIPYMRLIEIFQNTALKYGIPVVVREESYTSKASLLDLDAIPAYGKDDANEAVFSGNRIKRGIYVSADGRNINADVNAAGNIIRKEYPYAFDGFNFNVLCTTVERVKFHDLYSNHKIKATISGKCHKNHKSTNAFKRHEERKYEKRICELAFPPIRNKQQAVQELAA